MEKQVQIYTKFSNPIQKPSLINNYCETITPSTTAHLFLPIARSQPLPLPHTIHS